MKTSDYFPTEFPFTLPTKLDKFVEETVKGIQPLKMEDYYRSRLKESIWKIYQEEDQSEAQTLKRLGNRKTIRNQIDQELEMKKKQENSVLWELCLLFCCAFGGNGKNWYSGFYLRLQGETWRN